MLWQLVYFDYIIDTACDMFERLFCLNAILFSYYLSTSFKCTVFNFIACLYKSIIQVDAHFDSCYDTVFHSVGDFLFLQMIYRIFLLSSIESHLSSIGNKLLDITSSKIKHFCSQLICLSQVLFGVLAELNLFGWFNIVGNKPSDC